jgi:integrase/recombinase XerD
METIILKPLQHNQEENIGMYFPDVALLNKSVRKIKKARWTTTHKCWYVPLGKQQYNEIVSAFKGLVTIEQSSLHQYLADKKKKNPVAYKPGLTVKKDSTTKPAITPARKTVQVNSGLIKKPVTVYKSGKIQAANVHILPAMEQQLKLKAYSSSTIKTYLGEMTQLLTILNTIPADDLKPEHLKRYLVHCYEKLKLTENSLHSRINAMKFYYEQVLGREKFFWEIPRPKKQLQLPRFFSQQDIVAIIKTTENLKHKVMLMLAYSAGLRVSEVVSMKTRNIDEARMSILIEQAKGKKDRMVTLSPVLLVMLRKYIIEYYPDPRGYLFAGQFPDEPYSTRSMQLVLAAAKEKAGILKPGSVHALRHSFATHLLDKGTDVTLIMKLLGHNDIKTTLRYLHVTNRDMLQIISPLDDLNLE